MSSILRVALVVVGTIMVVLITRSSPARASTCAPTVGGQSCASGLPNSLFLVTAYKAQRKDQWCWAASEEMVFRYYGHPVDQSEIVSAVYGSPVNLPSGPYINIVNELNRTYTDDNGVPFTVSTTDVTSATDLIAALDAGQPVIVTSSHHVMVLTGLGFTLDPAGNLVQFSARVQDPWPDGAYGHPGGSRLMDQNEFGGLVNLWAVSVN